MDINFNKNEFEGTRKERVVEKVRNITEKDIKRIWEIRNNPSVRENSNNPEEIPLDKHTEWMKNKYFINTDNYCFVLDFNDRVIGYCRFDLQNGKYIISIAIDQDFYGMSLGDKLLKISIKKMGLGEEILAEIQLGNIASLKIFQKNNFKIYRQDDKNYYLSLTT
ncbi:GNAT family N-acetyltransferase [Patescibacteria group bacterium]|nr:GNAT family N-acetyltransferase [Patescibacteria group bacterium]